MNFAGPGGKRSRASRICGMLVFLLLLPLFQPASAATGHALVVAVSQYKNLPGELQLQAPKYDAEMILKFLHRHQLRAFPKENIVVLADGIAGAADPTRKAILGAMANIAGKAGKGDFVYLHFSGHGSQQPAKEGDNTETDGLDELFLPADVGKWNDSVGKVDNALVDDEIGEAIDAIRNKGAFVWAVFDSCHSGEVTRGVPAGDDVRMRKVAPAMLGIPDKAMAQAARNAPLTRTGGAPGGALDGIRGGSKGGKGGLVAFYAAQSNEQTPEMRLPAGAEGRQPHGLFSFTLFRILTEHPGITYRQAAQQILQHYAASYLDRPTPLFEGDLDAPVFGSTAAAEKPQWPIEIRSGEMRIPAGSLSRLAEGAIVAILRSPAAADAEAVAYARVVKPQTMDSTLASIAYKGKQPLASGTLPEGAYARLIQYQLDFGLKVARPVPDPEQPAETRERLQRVLGALKPGSDTGLRIQWVKAGEPADIRLAHIVSVRNADGKRKVLDSEHLWLLPPTGDVILEGGGKTPSIALRGKSDEQLKQALLDNLTRVARVLNLLRVSRGRGAGTTTLQAQLTVKRKADQNMADVPPETVPRLYAGDEVHLSATNKGKSPVDVNVLFIGSDYSISHWYKGRIHAGGVLKQPLFRVSASSLGTERVVVIAQPAREQSMVQDFSFLAQSAMPKTRDVEERGLKSLLREAGFGAETTRGVEPPGSEAGEPGSILQLTIETALKP